MADTVTTGSGSLLQAAYVASTIAPRVSPNGVRFAAFGDTRVAEHDLLRVVQAVPVAVVPALQNRVFYFVPLAIPETRAAEQRPDLRVEDNGRTLIATHALPDLFDDAICHRNVLVPPSPVAEAHEGVFISARLLRDTFALAFEFFINVGHAFAEHAGIPQVFSDLVWSQAVAEIRGETSQDAWETRAAALEPATRGHVPDEKAKLDYFESTFADALAIYQLSLAVDFDYAELREREYPLLVPAALADRLRLMAKLFPPNQGYDFSIRYRRR
jgi:hypothetical protein